MIWCYREDKPALKLPRSFADLQALKYVSQIVYAFRRADTSDVF